MARTKYFGIKMKAAQQAYVLTALALTTNRPNSQRILVEVNKPLKRVVLTTVFVQHGRHGATGLKGYQVIVFADGSRVFDRDFEVAGTLDSFQLVRPESFNKAA